MIIFRKIRFICYSFFLEEILSFVFLRKISESGSGFETNPFYSILHEAIYWYILHFQQHYFFIIINRPH